MYQDPGSCCRILVHTLVCWGGWSRSSAHYCSFLVGAMPLQLLPMPCLHSSVRVPRADMPGSAYHLRSYLKQEGMCFTWTVYPTLHMGIIVWLDHPVDAFIIYMSCRVIQSLKNITQWNFLPGMKRAMWRWKTPTMLSPLHIGRQGDWCLLSSWNLWWYKVPPHLGPGCMTDVFAAHPRSAMHVQHQAMVYPLCLSQRLRRMSQWAAELAQQTPQNLESTFCNG